MTCVRFCRPSGWMTFAVGETQRTCRKLLYELRWHVSTLDKPKVVVSGRNYIRYKPIVTCIPIEDAHTFEQHSDWKIERWWLFQW